MFPAKKMPGTETLSKNARLRRDAVVQDRHDAELAQVAERAPEARREDDLVRVEVEPTRPGRPVGDHARAPSRRARSRTIDASTTYVPAPPRTYSS